MNETGSESLKMSTCAVCAVRCLSCQVHSTSLHDCDLSCLRVPTDTGDVWMGTNVPLPYESGPLAGLQFDPQGVDLRDDEDICVSICSTCNKSLRKKKIPKFSLVNSFFLGEVPVELQELTIIEESMIALCWSKCYVIQLKDNSHEVVSHDVPAIRLQLLRS
jgi:hypothetical protein